MCRLGFEVVKSSRKSKKSHVLDNGDLLPLSNEKVVLMERLDQFSG